MIDRAWPLLAPAAEQWGEHNKESVRSALIHGATLWLTEGAATVASVRTHPTGLRVANAWLAGGDLTEMKTLESAMVNWAKANGCHQARIYGRRGFLRALPGFRELGTVLVRDLGQ